MAERKKQEEIKFGIHVLHFSLLTFHARIRVRHLTGPARAAIVGHVLCRLVLDDIPVGLLVHQLNARAHLAGMRGRLAGCADVLPGGSRVHLGCLHRHRDRTLLHANVSPVWTSGKGMYCKVSIYWISTFFLTIRK